MIYESSLWADTELISPKSAENYDIETEDHFDQLSEQTW